MGSSGSKVRIPSSRERAEDGIAAVENLFVNLTLVVLN